MVERSGSVRGRLGETIDRRQHSRFDDPISGPLKQSRTRAEMGQRKLCHAIVTPRPSLTFRANVVNHLEGNHSCPIECIGYARGMVDRNARV